MSNFIKDDELKGKMVMLSDVEVDGLMDDRLTTGSDLLDRVFGGEEMPGVMRGTTTLVTGDPGSGKSTMMLQLAQMLSHNGQRVILNIGEESSKMVAYRARKLGIRGDFEVSAISEAEELHERIVKEAPDVFIQDSLQSLRVGGERGAKSLVESCEHMINISKRTQAAVMLVGHVTKSGVFAGPKTIQHDIDAHMHLNVGMDGGRTAQMQKNRFGPAHVAFQLFMAGAGLNLAPADPVPLDTTNPNRAMRSAERQARAIEAIEAQFVLGERLSAYSLDDNADLRTVITSPSYMRHYLRLAVESMAARGFKMASATVNRRETWWVEA
jgi:predicted ATP-dependent serine protease